MAKVTMLVAEPADTRRLELTLRLTAQGRIDGDARTGPATSPGRSPGPPPMAASTWASWCGSRSGWAVRQHPGDDDPLWRLEAGVLRPGERVTLREPDGTATEFRVVAVEQD